jgi:hypothetical protein
MLGHAAGKLVRVRILEAAQTHKRNMLGDSTLPARGGHRPIDQAKPDILRHGEPRKQARFLNTIPRSRLGPVTRAPSCTISPR